VTVKTTIYLIVILFALALGAWIFPAPNEKGIRRQAVLFSLAASFVFAFMFYMNRLLGQNVLLSFVTGRYHQPRLAERVFLFIDMVGSTGFAEWLGPLAFHRLVDRFVVDLSGPIAAARGEIHRYIGDELIATWMLAEACFAAVDQLALSPTLEIIQSVSGDCDGRRAALRSGPWCDGEL